MNPLDMAESVKAGSGASSIRGNSHAYCKIDVRHVCDRLRGRAVIGSRARPMASGVSTAAISVTRGIRRWIRSRRQLQHARGRVRFKTDSLGPRRISVRIQRCIAPVRPVASRGRSAAGRRRLARHRVIAVHPQRTEGRTRRRRRRQLIGRRAWPLRISRTRGFELKFRARARLSVLKRHATSSVLKLAALI